MRRVARTGFRIDQPLHRNDQPTGGSAVVRIDSRAEASGAPRWDLPMLAGEFFRAAAVGYLVVLVGLLTWALLPTAFGWRATVVISGSMAPAVDVGDVVVFDHEDVTHLTVGRVLLFDDPNRPGELVTHRLDGWRSDGSLITKGDANNTPDPAPLRPEHVRGAARAVIPTVGLLAVWGDGPVQGHWLRLITVLAGCLVTFSPASQRRPTAPRRRHGRRIFGRRAPGAHRRASQSRPRPTRLPSLALLASAAE